MEGRKQRNGLARRREANKTKALQNKIAKVEQMIADLKGLLKESYRHFVLANREIEQVAGKNGNSKRPLVRFEVAFVENLFSCYDVVDCHCRCCCHRHPSQDYEQSFHHISCD